MDRVFKFPKPWVIQSLVSIQNTSEVIIKIDWRTSIKKLKHSHMATVGSHLARCRLGWNAGSTQKRSHSFIKYLDILTFGQSEELVTPFDATERPMCDSPAKKLRLKPSYFWGIAILEKDRREVASNLSRLHCTGRTPASDAKVVIAIH